MARYSLFLVVLLFFSGTPRGYPQAMEQHVEGYPGVPVIGPWIRIHERAKKVRGNEALPASWRSLRVDRDHPDSELCAIYVGAELTPQDIDGFELLGIEFNHRVFVPALQDRHPFGYHLGRVPYHRLDELVADPSIVMVRSVETVSYPTNNRTVVDTNADVVHDGSGVIGSFDGTAVTIAIADSGIDLDHDDFPTPEEAYDVTSGSGPSTWDDDVSNTIIFHGTHVSGIAVGRGTLSDDNTGNGSGAFKGTAPEADFNFYKIADDDSGTAIAAWEILAIDRAVEVDSEVFTMSYGGVGTFLDGSSATCQALDAAHEDGMLCFVSAGNDGASNRHASIDVDPGETVTLDLIITNPFIDAIERTIGLQMIWIDDEPTDEQMALTCTNLEPGESLDLESEQCSLRGTESGIYTMNVALDGLESRSYELELENEASDGDTPLVHLWRTFGAGVFEEPDPAYTVLHPAVADTVMAVGAIAQRSLWTDADGVDRVTFLDVGELAPFSSRGPRIDGVMKPDVTAPGAMTISCRDSDFANGAAFVVDNDGDDLDGSGPADYYVASGTSMSSPAAAGVAALIREAQPDWTADQVLDCMLSTAASADEPDEDVGYGLVDAQAAVLCAIDCNENDLLDADEIEDGTVTDIDDNGIPDSCQDGLIGFTLSVVAESPPFGDDTTDAIVVLDSTIEIHGYQFGVCDGPPVTLESDEDIAPGDAISIDDDFTFHALQVVPGGWTVGALYDVTADLSLAAGSALELYIATYQLVVPGSSTFELCDDLGDPEIPTLIISGSEEYDPESISASIDVTGGFIRGDANQDFTVDISDPFYIGLALFDDGDEVMCEDAGDADDSETLDIGDALYLLIYLFNNGPELSDPFPDCGEDPVGTALDCEQPYCL